MQRVADLLGYVKQEHILDLVQSILALQRDYGNRKLRKNARMKYLIHTKGIQWFKKILTSKYFKEEVYSPYPEPPAKLKDYLGWNKQSPGLYFVGIPLMSGRLSGETKAKIRFLVENLDFLSKIYISC